MSRPRGGARGTSGAGRTGGVGRAAGAANAHGTGRATGAANARGTTPQPDAPARFTAADEPTRESLEHLCAELAERTGTDARDWFVTFKARQAMKVTFDALHAEHPDRDEVATQLYTCCTAVDPIVAAGLTPVYGDLSPRTLALDVRRTPVGRRTAAVVLQHTFGICDAEADAALRDAAHAAGALVLEDCAHCAGRLSRDASGVPVADISVHSFGVEKLLPTHFGGAVWVNPAFADEALRVRLRAALAGLPTLAPVRARAAKRYLNQIRVLNHLPRGLSHSLRERLAASGRFEPAIAPVELAGGLASEPELANAWVADRAFWALKEVPENERARSVAVAAYAEALADLPREPSCGTAWACAGGLADAQPLLRLGVFVPGEGRADEAVRRLRAEGHYTVPWYRPLLFPGVSDEARYGLPDGLDAKLAQLPVTRACSVGAVCLPTDIAPERAADILASALA